MVSGEPAAHSQLFVIGIHEFTMTDRLNEENFVNGECVSEKRTIVVFHATWCPFCRRFVSEFEQLVPSKGVEAALVDISDVDSPLWNMFSIDVVPTAILFESGKPVARLDGKSGIGIPPVEFRTFAERAIV
jgi:thioredoxin 1